MSEKKCARHHFWVSVGIAIYGLGLVFYYEEGWIKAVVIPVVLFSAWLAWVFALYAWGNKS